MIHGDGRLWRPSQSSVETDEAIARQREGVVRAPVTGLQGNQRTYCGRERERDVRRSVGSQHDNGFDGSVRAAAHPDGPRELQGQRPGLHNRDAHRDDGRECGGRRRALVSRTPYALPFPFTAVQRTCAHGALDRRDEGSHRSSLFPASTEHSGTPVDWSPQNVVCLGDVECWYQYRVMRKVVT